MKTRLASLDIFRGITVAGMILVNNPGSWDDDFPALLHSTWDGCTLADLIFPSFLFIAGVSIPLSREARLARGAEPRDLTRHILRRGIILLALGLTVTWFTGYDWHGGFVDHLKDWRLPGVLQRIAFVYTAAALLDLYARPWQRAGLGVVLLFGYWAAMTLIPVPGSGAVGAAALSVPNGTLAAYVDRALFDWGAWGNHLWYLADPSGTWDPEGVLSTIPAIVTGLLGVAAGRWLQRPLPLTRRLAGLALGGVVLVALGYLWDLVFPINKALWTSSYVLLAGGYAALALAALGWVADVRGYTRWALPFSVFGVNAIIAFAGDEIVGSLLYKIGLVPADNGKIDLASAFYRLIVLPRFEPRTASLVFALSMVALWGAVLTVLYRRKIFLKI
jgi:predicted acyltransferase